MTSANDTPTARAGSKWDDSEFHNHSRRNWLFRHKRETLIFAVLAILTLLVVIWLPKLVAPVTLSPSALTPESSNGATGTRGTASPGGSLESPWEEAQITRARREAQEVLAKLLDRQSRLENMNAEQWAADDFARALQTAAAGDELYTQREFAAAQKSYVTALQQLDELVARADEVFDKALQDAQLALQDQDSGRALAQFSLALAIDAEDDNALQGLERARVLDQLLARLDEARNLFGTDLDAALQVTESALALDPLSPVAQAQRQDIQSRIRDRDFASAMGRGFQNLQEGQYQRAITQFQQALGVKPDNPDASSALASARNQELQARIQQHLRRATKLESGEQWAEALSVYQQVQALDSSLVSARVGALRSGARAQLDQRLQKLIDEPLRLSDAQVLQEAQTLLRDAHQVQPRGERIDTQARQLQLAIDKSQVAVPIRLQSDNKTQVTLYRVGKLGSFNEHSLDLKPGHYTLVGNRQGYRDVREEFTVAPGEQQLTIVIQCTEKISLGG